MGASRRGCVEIKRSGVIAARVLPSGSIAEWSQFNVVKDFLILLTLPPTWEDLQSSQPKIGFIRAPGYRPAGALQVIALHMYLSVLR